MRGRSIQLVNAITFIALIAPTSPERTTRDIACTGGSNARVWPESSFTPFLSAAAIIASASLRSTASGFSTTTCLPALAAMMAWGMWSGFGVATQMASTFGSAQSSSMVAYAVPPNSRSNASRACGRRSATATASTLASFRIVANTPPPAFPIPTTPNLSVRSPFAMFESTPLSISNVQRILLQAARPRASKNR